MKPAPESRTRRAGALAAALTAAACAASPDRAATGAEAVPPVHVREWGAGPDVLLIHGAASHSGEFAVSLAPALSGEFHMVAYDRPGMGRTDWRPGNAEDLGVQADAAAAVIRAQGLDRPVVAGHSFGGAVALRLALDHPDLISGLVLIAPVSHSWKSGIAWHYHVSANPLVGPVFNNLVVPLAAEGATRSAVENVFAPRTPPEDYFEDAEVALSAKPGAVRANAEDMVALNENLIAQSPRYGGIAMPVEIIAGADDQVLANWLHAEALEREIPGARLTVLEGAGHMPQHARPDLVAEAIARVRAEAGAAP